MNSNAKRGGGTGGKAKGCRVDVTALALSLEGMHDEDYLTKTGMCQLFKCTSRTIQRMVDRFEIPPPARAAGRNIWNAARLRAWIAAIAEHREAEAAKTAKRMRVFTA